MKRFLTIVLFAALTGCPPPQPITGARCATDDDIRANCGVCTSARACAWCASDGPQRGCYDRAQPFACDGTVLTILEACEEVPESQAGL
jgi:hypothetical protein